MPIGRLALRHWPNYREAYTKLNPELHWPGTGGRIPNHFTCIEPHGLFACWSTFDDRTRRIQAFPIHPTEELLPK